MVVGMAHRSNDVRPMLLVTIYDCSLQASTFVEFIQRCRRILQGLYLIEACLAWSTFSANLLMWVTIITPTTEGIFMEFRET